MENEKVRVDVVLRELAKPIIHRGRNRQEEGQREGSIRARL